MMVASGESERVRMAERVDHAVRRRQIAEAAASVAATQGLHAVSMRTTAAAAGVSVTLVQYYFTNKQGLLLGLMNHLERQSVQRWHDRIQATDTGDGRAVLDAFVAEAIPDDEDSRVFHLVGTSFAMLVVTDPALNDGAAGLTRLETVVADAFRQAGMEGSDRDPAVEAYRLVALVNGLGTSVLLGHRTAAQAIEAASEHLDDVLTGG